MPVIISNMKTLKKYRYVLAAVVVIAVMVLIRAFNPGSFRYDAAKWAEPSVTGRNIVTPENLPEIGDNILFVMLDTECQAPDIPGADKLSVDPADLFSGEIIRKIRKSKGPVVLCSEDVSISSRVWMALSEMGIRKLHILKNPV